MNEFDRGCALILSRTILPSVFTRHIHVHKKVKQIDLMFEPKVSEFMFKHFSIYRIESFLHRPCDIFFE